MAFLKSLPSHEAYDKRLSEAGIALPLVLAVLAALVALAAIIMQRSRGGMTPWVRAKSQTQAFYLAESGLAWALYQERYKHAPDSSLGDSSKTKSGVSDFIASGNTQSDTLQNLYFKLDTALALPEVQIDRSKPFLEVNATGTSGKESVKIKAQFGRALDAQIFGSALTWENDSIVTPFSQSQIRGGICLKIPTPGITSSVWPEGLSIQSYAQEFATDLFRQADAALSTALAKEGGEAGNGHFEIGHLPDFTSHDKEYRYPLAQVEFVGGAFDTLVVRGPGAFYAHGEIRARGKVRFENITLASEGDIILEGEVSGSDVNAYARKNLTLMGRTSVEIQGLAGGDIYLRDDAKTINHSLLLILAASNATGKTPKAGKAPKQDSVHAIRIVNQARAEGFLLALGQGSRIVMAGAANRVRGVILAEEAWLAGTVEGSVAARTLRCAEKTPPRCLGEVLIDRLALPKSFLQPLRMGPADAKHLQFQLLSFQVR
jgi:hypothetical protein